MKDVTKLAMRVSEIFKKDQATPQEIRHVCALILLVSSKAPEHAVNSLRKVAREAGHVFEE